MTGVDDVVPSADRRRSAMATRRTSDVFVDALLGEGVTAVFGNPGTTELPVMESLAASGAPGFYLGLQEIVCVGMADGYAQATGRPAVVNLHASPGLGNAMGNLYNAWRTGTPLVVTVGQQDTRFNLDEPLLHSDLVRQASQYTKWSWELRRADELGSAVRRAFKEATTPPTGPTFLSLPMDLMDSETEGTPEPSVRLPRAGAPPSPDLARVVELLAGSAAPVIVVGDRVEVAGAREEIVMLAERLAAPVWAEPMAQRLPFPPEHPQFAGFLPPFGPLVRESLGDADVVLVVGSDAFLLYPPFERGSPFPNRSVVIHIDEVGDHVARSHTPDATLIGDLGLVARLLMSDAREDTSGRDDRVRAAVGEGRRRARERAERALRDAPVSPAAVATMLGRVCAGKPVVDEAVTMTGPLQRSWVTAAPRERYGHRGGGLGWGLPAALGVALARRGQRTLALLGDGSAMYAIQGLWTAARYQLDISFVVFVNGGYEIIRAGLRRQGGTAAARGAYLGTDLVNPALSWGDIAAGVGLSFRSCADAADIGDAARELEAVGGPGLMTVPVEGEFTLP